MSCGRLRSHAEPTSPQNTPEGWASLVKKERAHQSSVNICTTSLDCGELYLLKALYLHKVLGQVTYNIY